MVKELKMVLRDIWWKVMLGTEIKINLTKYANERGFGVLPILALGTMMDDIEFIIKKSKGWSWDIYATRLTEFEINHGTYGSQLYVTLRLRRGLEKYASIFILRFS